MFKTRYQHMNNMRFQPVIVRGATPQYAARMRLPLACLHRWRTTNWHSVAQRAS